MHFETKIFLLCLTVVLLPKAVHSTDIEILSCKSKTKQITATAKTNGFYYYVSPLATGSLTALGLRNQTDINLSIPQPKKPNTAATVIRVNIKGLLTQGYDVYSVTCKSVVKTTLTITLPVSQGTTPKPENIKTDEDIKVTFKVKQKNNVNAVILGDDVTMVMTQNKIFKTIKVKTCDVLIGNGKSIPTFRNQTNDIMKLTSPGNLNFKAFLVINQKTNTLKFQCEVLLCMESSCQTGKHPGPIFLEASRDVKYASVNSKLTVYLPPHDILSHATKVTSYTKGALLTLGAVLIQRQLG